MVDQPIFETTLSLKAQIEACLFASPQPVTAEDILAFLGEGSSLEEVENAIATIKEEYDNRSGGFSLKYLKGLGYQFQTPEEASFLMAKIFASRPRPLSKAALETLAIIAYRQPTTRASIEFIRGVDSGSIIKHLLEQDFIKCVGRKEDAGRPMLFATTPEFLRIFGLASLKDLPPLQAFQPTSETMAETLKELDEFEKVDVERFIGDENQEEPKVSDGLLVDVDIAKDEEILR